MSPVVLDASALLALLLEEKGKEIVVESLPNSVISAVNLTEVAVRLVDGGMDAKEAAAILDDLQIEIAPFDDEQAYLSAYIRARTSKFGLSLGDRACLALAISRNLSALTADKAWKDVKVGAKIRLVR